MQFYQPIHLSLRHAADDITFITLDKILKSLFCFVSFTFAISARHFFFFFCQSINFYWLLLVYVYVNHFGDFDRVKSSFIAIISIYFQIVTRSILKVSVIYSKICFSIRRKLRKYFVSVQQFFVSYSPSKYYISKMYETITTYTPIQVYLKYVKFPCVS